MKRVILETPYAGDRTANIRFALDCLRDCLSRDESAIASHLLYPQVLDDDIPEERELGIRAGLAWVPVADATVVYVDLGISKGMQRGMDAARKMGRPVVIRRLRGGGE